MFSRFPKTKKKYMNASGLSFSNFILRTRTNPTCSPTNPSASLWSLPFLRSSLQFSQLPLPTLPKLPVLSFWFDWNVWAFPSIEYFFWLCFFSYCPNRTRCLWFVSNKARLHAPMPSWSLVICFCHSVLNIRLREQESRRIATNLLGYRPLSFLLSLGAISTSERALKSADLDRSQKQLPMPALSEKRLITIPFIEGVVRSPWSSIPRSPRGRSMPK